MSVDQYTENGSYQTKSLKATEKRQRRIQCYYCLDCSTSFSEKAKPKRTKRYEPPIILKEVLTLSQKWDLSRHTFNTLKFQELLTSLKELLINSSIKLMTVWI